MRLFRRPPAHSAAELRLGGPTEESEGKRNIRVSESVQEFVDTVLPSVGRTFNVYEASLGHSSLIHAAAQRWGLDVAQHGQHAFFYKGEVLVGGMNGMVTSLVSTVAVSTCKSKPRVRALLERAGVNVAPGRAFKSTEFGEALRFFLASDGPVVVKPGAQSGGRGITVGVMSEGDFGRAWERAVTAGGPKDVVLVEAEVPGVDVRAYVVDGQCVAAATRLPPHVVGDGSRTVRELLDAKRATRAQSGYLRTKPLPSDAVVSERISVGRVPDVGEVVLLDERANLAAGGESVNVTDVLDARAARIAEAAVEVVPGLRVAGVDFLMPDIRNASDAVVLELNTHANIRVHHMPAYGAPVDVANEIVAAMVAGAG